jgi:hypothetical protein
LGCGGWRRWGSGWRCCDAVTVREPTRQRGRGSTRPGRGQLGQADTSPRSRAC